MRVVMITSMVLFGTLLASGCSKSEQPGPAVITNEQLTDIIRFRSFERIALIGFAAAALLVGAYLVKAGVYDRSDVSVVLGDRKLYLKSASPGLLLMLAAVGLASFFLSSPVVTGETSAGFRIAFAREAPTNEIDAHLKKCANLTSLEDLADHRDSAQKLIDRK